MTSTSVDPILHLCEGIVKICITISVGSVRITSTSVEPILHLCEGIVKILLLV